MYTLKADFVLQPCYEVTQQWKKILLLGQASRVADDHLLCVKRKVAQLGISIELCAVASNVAGWREAVKKKDLRSGEKACRWTYGSGYKL